MKEVEETERNSEDSRKKMSGRNRMERRKDCCIISENDERQVLTHCLRTKKLWIIKAIVIPFKTGELRTDPEELVYY